MLFTTIIFVVILGILVFVHEAGHFVVARRNGIKADEFGFGFPPRICGFWKNEKTGKTEFVWGNKHIESKNTVYSINAIPLGGFVKIKGENGDESKAKDSFGVKSPWIRIKVLAAGVLMNFFLGWVLLSGLFFVGTTEAIDDNVVAKNPKVQVSQISSGSPAEISGVQIGDEIVGGCSLHTKECVVFTTIKSVQEFANKYKGSDIALKIKRGNEDVKVSFQPRLESPANEGPMGVSLVRTSINEYSWYESMYKGAVSVVDMVSMIFMSLVALLKGIILGSGASMDVSGPIGIAVMTRQVAEMGFSYLVRFTAILSINLGIINILPIPALDGGRILFVLIEKIKGAPLGEKFEQLGHTIGFFLLIGLMIFVTFKDFARFDILSKIFGLF